MRNFLRFFVTFSFVLAICGLTLAQEVRKPEGLMPPTVAAAAPTVTATATNERVRFVAPGTVVQLRLAVYADSGQKIFDTEQHGGNVLDWHLQDGAGARLASGSYACVMTIKSLSGRISQRMGVVTVQDKNAAVQTDAAMKLSAAQQQAIGPIEGEASFTVIQSEAAMTAVMHDGADGQLSRTRGALSFRVGDFFSGTDSEQMRLSEEGNLGIGTDKPQAKLDVAGDIRLTGAIRTERIEFPDGTVQTKGQSGKVNPDGSVTPNATGTGTQNRVVKWTDNAGTLGDTAISEVNGSMVVGNAGQTGNIQIFGPATQDVFAGMGPDPANGPAFNYGYAGASFGRSAGFFNVRPDASAVTPNPSLRFLTANVERMIVTNTGNVGIGTTPLGFRLHVVDPSNAGLRVQTNTGGGTLASFGGNGDFSIDQVNFPGGRLMVKEAGNVGIGTSLPQAKLDVRGNIKLGATGQYFAPGGEENLRIVRGTIGINGNIIAGSGFQVSHTVTGQYHITFDTPFAGRPSATVSPLFDGLFASLVSTSNGMSVTTFSVFSANYESSEFEFIAIGPR